MKKKFSNVEMDDLILWFERHEPPSPNKIKTLILKYPNYIFYELQDGSSDYTWILAKDKKMAAQLASQREKKFNIIYTEREILDI